jgi:hypothetical protein
MAASTVALELRLERLREPSRLSPGERVARALELGEFDLEIFRLARGLEPAEAKRILRRNRQLGRRNSPCMLQSLE